MTKPTLHKKDIVYYTRILPKVGIYDLCELKVRTVDETYFAAIEKSSKQAFLFSYSAIGNTIFLDRKDALKRVRSAELNREDIDTETYYEEY